MDVPMRCRRLSFSRFGGAGSITGTWREEAPLLEEAVVALERAEHTLSRFDPCSELSRLNRGEHHDLAPLAAEALRAALAMAAWTDGLVTPLVGGALRRAGYDRSFETIDFAAERSLAPGAPAPDWRTVDVTVDGDVRLPPEPGLDLAGTAKGFLADRIVRGFGPEAPVLLELDGVFAANGPRLDGAPWLLPVTAPGSHRPVGFVGLGRGGVATSAPAHRRWFRGGHAVHHLIDPRTGEPVVTDVSSATVVAPSALLAQAAAKVVCLAGADAGLAFLAVHAELSGVVVRADGSVVVVGDPAAALVQAA